jgi:hypothetical protein
LPVIVDGVHIIVFLSFSFNIILMLDEPRTTKEGITDYFVNFLKNKPQGIIKDGVTLSGPVRALVQHSIFWVDL